MAACAVLAVAVTTGVVDLLSGQDPPPAPVASRTGGDEGPSPPTVAGEQSEPAPAVPSVPAPSPAPTSGRTPASPDPTAGPALPTERGIDLSVPALGLQTDVREIAPSGGVIDPPTFDHAYVIAPYGRPGSDNTTYIAGHSWNRGEAVFNPLLDVESQQAVLAPGDAVVVTQDGRTFTYEVTASRRYAKGSLADADEVWAKVPGRLVLITCFQRNDGAASRDNLVVTAELVA